MYNQNQPPYYDNNNNNNNNYNNYGAPQGYSNYGPQPGYQPGYQGYVDPKYQPPSIGSWILTFFLLAIPIVNIIYIMVGLFGGTNKSKTNFFRAQLIVILIGTVITIIILLTAAPAIKNLLQEIINSLNNAGGAK